MPNFNIFLIGVMAAPPENETKLFRDEVFDAKRDTWLGQIVLIRPISFTFLTITTVLLAATVLAFLFWGEYTRKAKVAGYIVPSQGRAAEPTVGAEVVERHKVLANSIKLFGGSRTASLEQNSATKRHVALSVEYGVGRFPRGVIFRRST